MILDSRQSFQFRHADHEREWTRAEFRTWAEAAAEKHGYWISEFDGVGYLPDQESQGPCTQLAVFERKDLEEAAEEVEEAAAFSGSETQVDLSSISAKALRSQELDRAMV
ncbi:Small RNA 2'-O-methyltransferase [Symbiodinium microadriaticum]|uniref:Small RNA 2'-O-methyltransferase n=1 Tax=Symbiodinium microadriaticum TaxID=2951 RepID=A0A1Q9CNC9_SYMMI|nr:Small RNA 2'-O-methyltransferase [Symbiodinium microadriaticum]